MKQLLLLLMLVALLGCGRRGGRSGDSDADADTDSDTDADTDADADTDTDADTDADGDADPGDETCNGLDDDEDGQIDEGNPGGGVPCDTELPGPCLIGRTSCVLGDLACVPDQEPGTERCNNPGEDDDCDGIADNVPEVGQFCATGGDGVCASGTGACQGGSFVCVADALNEEEEVCDNLSDDDCDGNVDEVGCEDGFLHHTGYGQTWNDQLPTATYTHDQAMRACQEYVDAVSPGADFCTDVDCWCASELVLDCVYNDAGNVVGARKAWFFNGTYQGFTNDFLCANGLVWD